MTGHTILQAMSRKKLRLITTGFQILQSFLLQCQRHTTSTRLIRNLLTAARLRFACGLYHRYAGDFNPMHIHDANLSGVAFLKMPPGFKAEYEKEDHHPTAGCLEFLGSMPNHFARHSYIVKPEVGDFYLFPSWLTHQVYPFRSKGERRSLAFNVHFTMDNPVKGVNV
jgi:hypothetical protein